MSLSLSAALDELGTSGNSIELFTEGSQTLPISMSPKFSYFIFNLFYSTQMTCHSKSLCFSESRSLMCLFIICCFVCLHLCHYVSLLLHGMVVPCSTSTGKRRWTVICFMSLNVAMIPHIRFTLKLFSGFLGRYRAAKQHIHVDYHETFLNEISHFSYELSIFQRPSEKSVTSDFLSAQLSKIFSYWLSSCVNAITMLPIKQNSYKSRANEKKTPWKQWLLAFLMNSISRLKISWCETFTQESCTAH